MEEAKTFASISRHEPTFCELVVTIFFLVHAVTARYQQLPSNFVRYARLLGLSMLTSLLLS